MSLIEINRNPSAGQLRVFAGVGVPALCAAAGAVLWFRVRAPAWAWAVWAAGALFAVVGLVRPRLARGAFVALSYAAAPLGALVSVVLLALVYYGIMTPIGLTMRALGRDALGRRFDRKASSYWIPRRPVEDIERYFRQY